MKTMTASQMATLYGLKSSTAFNKLLVQCKVLRHTDKGFILAEDLRDRGLVTVIDTFYFLPNGIKATKKRAVWTPEGQQFIHTRLGRIGIVPPSEQPGLFNFN